MAENYDRELPPPSPPPPPHPDGGHGNLFHTMHQNLHSTYSENQHAYGLARTDYGYSTSVGQYDECSDETQPGASCTPFNTDYLRQIPISAEELKREVDRREANKNATVGYRADGRAATHKDNPQNPRRFEALYDYHTVSHDELSFDRGEHFTEVLGSQPEQGFLYVVNHKDRFGYIPSNYVTEVNLFQGEHSIDSFEDSADEEPQRQTSKEFEEFCSQNNIEDQTKKILMKEGLRDLSLLIDTPDNDLKGLGINMGQRKYIQKGLKAYKQRDSEGIPRAKIQSREQKAAKSKHGQETPKIAEYNQREVLKISKEELEESGQTLRTLLIGSSDVMVKSRKEHPECMAGRDMTDWLIDKSVEDCDVALERQEALGMWQALLENGVLCHAKNRTVFEDKETYYYFTVGKGQPSKGDKKHARSKIPEMLQKLRKVGPDSLKRVILHKKPGVRTEEENEVIYQIIRGLKALKSISEERKKQIAACVGFETGPEEGEALYSRKDKATRWYIILRGSVKHVTNKRTILKVGDDFGRLEKGDLRDAKVVIDEEHCEFITLEKEKYFKYIRPKPKESSGQYDDLDDSFENFCKDYKLTSETKMKLLKMGLDDLDLLFEISEEKLEKAGINTGQTMRITKGLKDVAAKRSGGRSTVKEVSDKKTANLKKKKNAKTSKKKENSDDNSEDGVGARGQINRRKLGSSKAKSVEVSDEESEDNQTEHKGQKKKIKNKPDSKRNDTPVEQITSESDVTEEDMDEENKSETNSEESENGEMDANQRSSHVSKHVSEENSPSESDEEECQPTRKTKEEVHKDEDHSGSNSAESEDDTAVHSQKARDVKEPGNKKNLKQKMVQSESEYGNVESNDENTAPVKVNSPKGKEPGSKWPNTSKSETVKSKQRTKAVAQSERRSKKEHKKNEKHFKDVVNSIETGKLQQFKEYVKKCFKNLAKSSKLQNQQTDVKLSRVIKGNTEEVNGFVIHKLPLLVTYTDDENKIRKCLIGSRVDSAPQKTILLVGATGCGKSTMVDGIVNYIFGIQLEDKYRLKIVDLEEGELKLNQSVSQTEWITAYKITPSKHTQVKYALTIVDMPGFGDTRGIERDKMLMKNIKHLFSTEGGLDAIDAVCFLAKSTDARLTPSQRYIFESVLSIFGDDIKDHIHVFASFADAGNAEVLNAMKDANVPYNKCFKFNNAALFPREGDPFIPAYWEMGKVGYTTFFEHVKTVESKSLTLTHKVLQEREKLNTMVTTLQENISLTLKKIEDQNNLEMQIKENMHCLAENENFELTIKRPTKEKVRCKEGEYVTYCKECKYTCHEECPVKQDENLEECAVMEDGHCIVCPKKCIWSDHTSNDFYYKNTVVKIKTTIEEMKQKYAKAAENIEEAEIMLKPVEEERKELQDHVEAMVKKVAECMRRLDEIALKKGPPSEEDYIDLLIENELQSCTEGYQTRIASLRDLKEKAKTLKRISENQDISDILPQTPSETYEETEELYVSCDDDSIDSDTEMSEPAQNDVILFKHEGNLFLGKVVRQHKVFVSSVSVNKANIDFVRRKIPKKLFELTGSMVDVPEWRGLLAVFPDDVVKASAKQLILSKKNRFLDMVGSLM